MTSPAAASQVFTETSSSGAVERGEFGPGCAVRTATKRLGDSKPRVVARCSGGDAGYLGTGGGGVGDRQRDGLSVDECDIGRLAVRKFHREAKAKRAPARRSL